MKFAQTDFMILNNRYIQQTEDGSHTIYVPDIDEHYHSIHGAIQESDHVFIQNGLNVCQKNEITILEIGFGTGLNALLTLLNKGGKTVNYIGVEKYPLNNDEIETLNYGSILDQKLFLQIHQCEWNRSIKLADGFYLHKLHADFIDMDFTSLPYFDIIYFDAFAPNKQEDMWQESHLRKIAAHTKKGGIFVTYCAKGEVRRRLERCGYKITRIPGPPGKKEMLSGVKFD